MGALAVPVTYSPRGAAFSAGRAAGARKKAWLQAASRASRRRYKAELPVKRDRMIGWLL